MRRSAAAVLAAVAILGAPVRAPGADGVAAPTAAPAPAVRVEGRVLGISGDRLFLVTREGTPVTVDLSAVPGDLRAVLFPGRDVELFGIPLPGGEVLAHGVSLDYGEALSASPY